MAIPLRATYRLQFHAGFTFADAEALVSYFAQLGVSHLYASPIFAARAGSMHGYDAIDPNRLNPELGTEAEFASLVDALHRVDMGLIIDIVPNHMVVHRTNLLLQEALCLGPQSAAARVFDIDWSAETVALPVLGGPLEDVLSEIKLELDDSGLLMAVYHDHAFALRPKTAASLLEAAGGEKDIVDCWRQLESGPEQPVYEDAVLATARLVGDERASLEAVLKKADVRAVLDEQRWTLANWRTAAETLSHRRFFNITELIGVRVDDPEVFARTHELAIELVRKGDVDGLRIDHIDGLSDPAGYCRRLREAVGPDVPIFVEKILGPHEVLPDWPIDGTTGYERLNEINRLMVDANGYRRLDEHLVGGGHLVADFPARLAASKRQVLGELFQPEVDALCRVGAKLETGLGEEALREATLDLLVHFPVYRSYVQEGTWSDADLEAWETTVARVRRHEGDAAAERATTLWQSLKGQGEDAAFFVTRFQQLSGPAMAKGLEDTELYRSVALTSVNEVGSEPDVPSATPAEAHDAVRRRVERGDRSLLPLATHDTKRGPDTRARINTLSFDPEAWIEAERRWAEAAASLREGSAAPDELDRWLIHQTVLGAWPIDGDRMTAYLEKAMREAKRHTRWEKPNEAYEGPAKAYAAALVGETSPARAEVQGFIDGIETAARINGVAQTILQLAWPGVPDIYQGTELWDHSLVDPDNRRPVDYGLRRRLLEGGGLPPLREDREGAAKMRVTATLLDLRRRHPGLLVEGEYLPLEQERDEVFAFARRQGAAELLVAVPLRGHAAEVAVPAELTGTWSDVLTGEPVEVSSRLEPETEWPFVLLSRGV